MNSIFWDYFEANTNKDLSPAEFHLLIGPVSTLYDGLEKVTPLSEDRLKLCNVNWGKFEGNSSITLLKKADQLEGLCPSNNIVNKFANSLKPLNEQALVMVTNLQQNM